MKFPLRFFAQARLSTKLAFSFGSVLALLGVVVTASHLGVGRVAGLADEVVSVDALQNRMNRIEVAHLEWAATVGSLFTDASVRRIDVQTDPTKCALGSWLAGEERRWAETEVPALASVAEAIVAPHQHLHESVISMNEVLARQGRLAGESQLLDIYRSRTLPSLQSVQAQLSRAREALTESASAHTDALATSAVSTRRGVLATGIGCFLVAIAASLLLGRSITRSLVRPLAEISRSLKVVATGDLSPRLDASSSNEIGELAGDFNSALDMMHGTVSGIRDDARKIGTSAQAMLEASKTIRTSAEDTASQAGVVSSSSSTTNEAIQSSASSSEEMSASIGEIAKNTSRAQRVASQAVDKARATREIVDKLGKSSSEIGVVVNEINEIAGQTNLLALNATIEAARAGDSGKGFGVVANEVKGLSQQTATATERIAARIASIQRDTELSIQAISEINETIGEVGEITTSIAGAVEEQSAAAGEIAQSSMQAANSTREISTTIENVAMAAQATTAGSNSVLSASNELLEMVDRMEKTVARFRM